MSEWGTVALGEILTLKYGRALKNGDRKGGPVPVVGSSGIVGWHDASIVDKSTLVIGRKGSIGSLTLTEGASWPIDTAYYADFDPEIVDLRWLAHQLAGFDLKLLNKAAAVPGLNRDDVYRLHTVLPPLTEQRRIASILDEVDAIRAKRRDQLTHLDELPQSLLHTIITSTAASEPLGDIASFVRGVTYKPTEVSMSGIGIMRTKNIQRRLDLSDIVRITPTKPIKNEKFLQEGDTLISSANSWNLVGKCSFVDELAEDLAIGGFVTALRPSDRVNPTYLYQWFNSAPIQQKVRSFGNKTTNISNLDMKRTVTLQVPLPSLRLQEEFADQVTAICIERDRVERALEADEELFAALQHRAFRGAL